VIAGIGVRPRTELRPVDGWRVVIAEHDDASWYCSRRNFSAAAKLAAPPPIMMILSGISVACTALLLVCGVGASFLIVTNSLPSRDSTAQRGARSARTSTACNALIQRQIESGAIVLATCAP
jgi:hypothetical protein